MTRRAAISEDQLVTYTMQLLRYNGWRAVHYRPARTARGWRTALSGDIGAPDIIAVHPVGGVLLLEAKSRRGRLSPAQVGWAQWASQASRQHPDAIAYAVITPDDMDGPLERLVRVPRDPGIIHALSTQQDQVIRASSLTADGEVTQ